VETKDKMIGIKVSEEFKNQLDEAAAKQSLTTSSFSRKCIEMLSMMPVQLWDYLKRFSETYNQPLSEVISTIISKYICDYLAWQRLNPNKPYVVQEFVPVLGEMNLNDRFNMLQEKAIETIKKQNEMEYNAHERWWTIFFLERLLVKKFNLSVEEAGKMVADAKYDARNQMHDNEDQGSYYRNHLIRKSEEEQQKILKDLK